MRSCFLYALFIVSLILPSVVFTQSVDDYTLFSDGNLIMRDRIRITDGLVGSNTYTQMGYDCMLLGNVVSRGNAVLFARTYVSGNATLSGVLIAPNAQVEGTVTQNGSVPSLTIPTQPVVPAEFQADITITAGSTKSVYDHFIKKTFDHGLFENGATIYLSNGTIIFNTLTIEDNVTIYCDYTGIVAPRILIMNGLTIGHNVRILFRQGSLDPSNSYNMLLYSNQTSPLQIGTDCRIEADIKAPQASVVVDDRTELSGKLHAKTITLGYNVSITDDAFVDNDGDDMSDRWERNHGLNPLVNDASGDLDGDGLVNGQEFICKTDPGNADTDQDGLDDGEEFTYWNDLGGTTIHWYDDNEAYDNATERTGDGLINILDPDSDNDGLLDGEEVAGWTVIRQGIATSVTTDPARIDSDVDGIPDGEERNGYATDFPSHTINYIGPNPYYSDPDGDGIDSVTERQYGLDPNDTHTQGYLSDRKYYDMVNRMGEWAVSPVTGHLNPQLPSTSTCILGANIDFGDDAATEMSIDREMELSIFLPQDGQPITFNLEFIDNGTPDANDRFYDIKYSGVVYPNGSGGAPPIMYYGAEDNSITWRITDPLYYLKGDYFLNFSCHYDKNAGEQPRTIRLYAYYDDGTRVRMQYISPVKTGTYKSPMHFNLLVTGGAQPAYFRGETAVSGVYSSYIDNVVISDFWGNVVREIGKKAFDGYWFQYELGTLNTYTGGGSGIFSCNRLEFDWVHNPMSNAHHCIFAIDEVGNAWDDVQITYQSDYTTQDYFCWSGGLAKETAVVRRGNAVHVAVTRPGLQYYNAQVIIRNRSGADVTSQFTIHKESGYEDYPAFDGEQQSWRENWIIETPVTAAAGMYSIEMRIGWWWSGTAPFYLIFNRTELSISDEAYTQSGYDEDTDGLQLDDDTDQEFDLNAYVTTNDQTVFTCMVIPFTKNATDIMVAAVDGETDIFEARDAVRQFVASLIHGGWGTSGVLIHSNITDEVLKQSGVTLAEALAGEVHPSHKLFGQCISFARVSVSVSRTIGIPSRLANGKGIYHPSYLPDPDGNYPPYTVTDFWAHEWSEAWIESPHDGADQWYVFDASEFVWTLNGMSAPRLEYGALWLVPEVGSVWVKGVDVTDMYKF